MEEKSESPTKPKTPGSPERCPICLAPPDKKARTNACQHTFCFSCLKEWSKVKAQCPLCKVPFTSILFNLRGEDSYDEEEVPQLSRNMTVEDAIRQGFARSVEELINSMSTFRRQFRARSEANRAALISATSVDVIRRRRFYYRNSIRVGSVNNNSLKRDISAAFYQSNPAQLHRLVPWLRRELMVLYGAHNMLMVNRLRELILSSITTCGLMSEQFYDEISPSLGDRTDHFIHEFQSFARSVHDISTYDENACYSSGPNDLSGESIRLVRGRFLNSRIVDHMEIEPPLAHSNIRVSSNHFSSRSSNSSSSQRHTSSRRKRRMAPAVAPSEIIEILSSSDNDEASSSKNLRENDTRDSEDEVEFVKYVKPLRQRTPDAYISLSSSGEEDVPGTSGLSSAGVVQVISDNDHSSTSSASGNDDDSDCKPKIKSVIVPVYPPANNPKLQKMKSRLVYGKKARCTSTFRYRDIDYSSSSESDFAPSFPPHRQKHYSKRTKNKR